MASMSAAADRIVTEPLISIASASYVPPRPMPEPLDFAGILINCGTGLIENIGEPSTLAVLAEYRNKIISSSDGAKSVTVVCKEVAAVLRPGMPVSRILDVIEDQQRRGYEILLGCRPPPY